MFPQEANEDPFVTLPVQMPALPSFPSAAVQEIRVRRNVSKFPTINDSRTLFLKNIPADSTQSHLRAVFSDLVGPGLFEGITFEGEDAAALAIDPAQAVAVTGYAKKRKRALLEEEERREEEAARLPEIWTRKLQHSSSTATVLLADEKSVQVVIRAISKLQKTKKYPVWGNGLADDAPGLGAAWISSHLQLSRGDKAETKKSVHAFFNTFNRKEKEAAELAKRLRNEPDEDGFVTVTRGGRNAPASRNEAEEAKTKMLDKQAKKKSELKNFYRFQLRQARKAEQAQLLKRFDEDRKKVNAMREKRGKFKPET